VIRYFRRFYDTKPYLVLEIIAMEYGTQNEKIKTKKKIYSENAQRVFGMG